MRLRNLILLSPLLLKCLFVSAQGIQGLQGLPFMKYYSTRDYDGGIQNWSITQNGDGLIYVANNFGLLEFDGNTWKRFPLPNETKMRDVISHPNGKIYVAAQGDFGYFTPSANSNYEFISLADSIPKKDRNFDETWKVFIQQNKIIFCTFQQIYIFENDKLKNIIKPDFAPDSFHFVNNTLYVNQLENGLHYLEDGILKPFENGSFFSNKTISSIIPLINNHLWIATLNQGVYTYNGSSFKTWSKENDQLFRSSSINDCNRLRNGNIVIGTQNNGLIITTPVGNIIQHLNKEQGLNNRTVLAIYEDVLGNLWLGHNNGITMVELNLSFSLIGEHSGLPGTGYDGFKMDNHFLLGTNNGLYIQSLKSNDINNQFEFIKGTEGQVYKIQNIDDHVLMGHHQGAFLIDDAGKETHISDILGSWTFLKLKGYSNYIIGGNYKGLMLFEEIDNTIKFIRKINGFEESSRVIEQDDLGNIWMTHGYKGVYKLTLNEALDSVNSKFYGIESGLPSNILINVWKVNNRLVFTTESQVYQYNPETDRFEIDKFFNDFFGSGSQINYMEQDILGNIYFMGVDEIGVLEKLPNGKYQKSITVFNRLKGLLNDDLQKLSILSTNEILYAAKEGFVLYSKDTPYNTNENYKTLIRSVTVTSPKDSLITLGKYLDDDNNISSLQPLKVIPKLDYEQNSISIEFCAPFMHTANNLHYQYQLEGLDDKWSEWTPKSDKEYTNLHEGSYSFKVRAINIYDKIGEEAIFSFYINPPWYRSTIAYAGYLILSIITLTLVFYFVETRHTREKQLLSIEQEKEINKKENELKSSEEVIQKLKNEKLKSAVELKNKELASSTVHLLNKNSFINSVKHNISTIIKRSKNQEVKKELSKIMGNIDKNIAEDNDWDNFAIHFDQVHGDFSNRIKKNYPNLTPQEMKLGAYLRMNLSTKEIAHLLNISIRGVEIARYRLRKKLELDRSNNLQEFILKY